MATVQMQVRVDEATKKQASELLNGLGLNMTDAINMFLKQIILQDGLPFEVKYPQYKPEVIEAMEEAKRISRDPNTKRYTDVKAMFKEILGEGS